MEKMAKSSHYSPRIERFLVTCLYHEARDRRMPMTRLVDSLLRESLAGTTGWQKATEQRQIRGETSRDHPSG